jgi:hypothetical protein
MSRTPVINIMSNQSIEPPPPPPPLLLVPAALAPAAVTVSVAVAVAGLPAAGPVMRSFAATVVV